MRLYAVTLATLLVASGGMAPSAVGQLRSADTSADQSRAVPRVVTLEDARLKFEINSTDHDGGVQVFIDAEEWKTMSIFDPEGNRIFSTQTSGRLARFGGSELFLESGEPPFSELPLRKLLKQWPAGVYRFRGTGADGQVFRGSARLTHRLPGRPEAGVAGRELGTAEAEGHGDALAAGPGTEGQPNHRVPGAGRARDRTQGPSGRDLGRDDAADSHEASCAAGLPPPEHGVLVGGSRHRGERQPDAVVLDVHDRPRLTHGFAALRAERATMPR